MSPGSTLAAGGRIGVLLVNLGTPDATNYWAMRRYLKEFLSDRRVIEENRLKWWLALNLVILTIRPGRKGRDYDKIWNKQRNESPLKTITRAQSDKLEGMLEKVDRRIRVDWAMRYGNPSIRSRLEALTAQDCERILIVPLIRNMPQLPPRPCATKPFACWSVCARSRPCAWPRLTTRKPPISMRSPPRSTPRSRSSRSSQKRSSPLSMACRNHTSRRAIPITSTAPKRPKLLRRKLKLDEEGLLLTFQSRFGPTEWIKPYTDATVKSLAEQGVKSLAVITPGFAADCLETLEEIAMENAEIFKAAGGKNFAAIPCLNDSARHGGDPRRGAARVEGVDLRLIWARSRRSTSR